MVLIFVQILSHISGDERKAALEKVHEGKMHWNLVTVMEHTVRSLKVSNPQRVVI